MKILFFGDIVGKIGRRAIDKILPKYKKKYQPDLVIANGENLAHGVGVTVNTVEEILKLGVDVLTGGNDTFHKKGFEEVFLQFENKIIRPANYPTTVAGRGYTTFKVHQRRIIVINLSGRVFMSADLDCPFQKFDEIYKLLKIVKNDIVLVDFHAEATSEKSALGWYLDSKVAAVMGTHTHIPTADGKILPGGTAFVTDIGMTGARDSIIGVDKVGPLHTFLTQLPAKFERPEEGTAQVGAILVEVNDETGLAKSIKRVDAEVMV